MPEEKIRTVDTIIDWIVKIAAVLVIPMVVWCIRIETHRTVQEERHKVALEQVVEMKKSIQILRKEITRLRDNQTNHGEGLSQKIARMEAQIAILMTGRAR